MRDVREMRLGEDVAANFEKLGDLFRNNLWHMQMFENGR